MRVVLAAVLLALACHPHAHEHDHDEHGAHERHGPAGDEGHGRGAGGELPALSFTDWSEATELFLELPVLVRGSESTSAAHVTVLEPFSPLARGEVTAVLRGPAGEERFSSKAPSRPGIFSPVIKPAGTGTRRLVIELRAEGLASDHDLGEVTVYADVAAARKAIPEEPEATGRITFLKEQQWAIAFGTAVVQERPIRPTLRAAGKTRARTDGEILIVAPASGRVASGDRAFPRLGERVEANELLGVLAPRLEAADLASLELAVRSAELELRFAERERARLQSLRGEGAVPERRVAEAVHAAEGAQASLETARRRLDQFRRVDRAATGGESGVQLRAPLSGTVTEVHAAPGTFVAAGAPLLRVTDLTQLWLEVRVPEVDVLRLGTPRGASFAIEGSSESLELPAEALVARSHVVEARSRTLALMFAFDNAGARYPLGAHGRVLLVTGEERAAVTVPESALVDDGGTDVVFVQVEGEAFERRMLRLGERDRGYVEVRSGLRAGEHVVSRGAWSVKLAAASGGVPAHGHAH